MFFLDFVRRGLCPCSNTIILPSEYDISDADSEFSVEWTPMLSEGTATYVFHFSRKLREN